MARVVKTDYNSKGYKHREHRSKKGRRLPPDYPDRLRVFKEKKRELEEQFYIDEIRNITRH